MKASRLTSVLCKRSANATECRIAETTQDTSPSYAAADKAQNRFAEFFSLSTLRRSHTNSETPDEDVDDAWGNAKRAVATYLLWATRQGKEHQAITKAIDELALLGVELELDDRVPDARKIDRIRELNT
eukprot:scaffold305801_cov35-Tisochrysis_lutea.AAC.1